MDPFTNLPARIDSLPQAQSLEFRKVDRRYAPMAVLTTVLFLLIPLAVGCTIAGFAESLARAMQVLAGGVVIIALIGAITWMHARSYAVALREHDVALRKGWIWTKTIFVVLTRVQHVEVSRGPFERRAGLSTLKVFTSGGAQSDLTIPGLTADIAERLRQQIAGAE